MPCEILTVALADRHANVVKAVEEVLTSFKAEHGIVRALISKTAADGFKMSLADSTHGSQNGLDPGALFELGGVQFFEYAEIRERNENGVPVLCELECLEHAPKKKKGWPKGKPRSRRVADRGQPDPTASPKDRGTADHAPDSVPSVPRERRPYVLDELANVAFETGLNLRPGLTWEQYEGIAHSIGRANVGLQWWAGDLAQYGETHFGERYAQILDDLGYEMETIANCKWVCGRFPIERRHKFLKFKHHAEVAGMKAETADVWLERAEHEEWSANELRENIKNAKEITATETDKPKRGAKSKKEDEVAGKKLSLKKTTQEAPAATPVIAGMAKILTEYQTKINGITEPPELFEELKLRTSDSMEAMLGLSAAFSVVNQDVGNEDIAEMNLKVLREAIKSTMPALILMDRIAERAVRMVEEAGSEG